MRSKTKFFIFLLAGFIGLYLLLLIPGKPNPIVTKATQSPFIWDRDNYWNQLEANFQIAKKKSPDELDSLITQKKDRAEKYLLQLKASAPAPADDLYFQLEENFFNLAPLIAVRPNSKDWFIDYYNIVRNTVKLHSQDWDMNDAAARNTVYAMLYGMRAALEEVLLQLNFSPIRNTMLVNTSPSSGPSVELLGMEVHSGDLLLSRGGAEVSALISRGNDYPGNFSHVALIYIDQETNIAHIIEAHIEMGVAVTDLEGYLKDKKLRVMVLRLRADLPALVNDPLLAHKAAKFMYDESLSRHIPYDFKMDFHNADAMFCSEVGSYAYQNQGVTLWQSVSTISSQGIVNWMHSFGVENFVTQMPSDLEYDPQLEVVGEWRDAESLFKDHLDNAVVDVMLEDANEGKMLEINNFQLPLARILKGYCLLLNEFGTVCKIPEGMNATTALRNNAFINEFQRIKNNTQVLIDQFILENNYRPPYWKLIELAETASQNNFN